MKKIVIGIIALTMILTMSACGNTEETASSVVATEQTTTEETTTKETTTTKGTTTTSEVTTTETETAENEADTDEDKFELLSSDELSDDGSMIEIYQNQEEFSWTIKLKFNSDNKEKNIVLYAQVLKAVQEQASDIGMPSNLALAGYYKDEMLFTCMMSRENSKYISSMGTIFLDDQYQDTFNSILNGDIDLSEYGVVPDEEINTLIYDNNGIKITYKGIDEDESMFGPKIKLLIENNTDENYTVQVRDFSINGYMVDTMFSANISAGKKINDGIIIFEDEFENNNISVSEIEKDECKFHVYSSDDRSDKFDTETISFDI